MVGKLTELYIKQYERDKKSGKKEYIKMSIQDFYKGLIKLLKEINYESN